MELCLKGFYLWLFGCLFRVDSLDGGSSADLVIRKILYPQK